MDTQGVYPDDELIKFYLGVVLIKNVLTLKNLRGV
jgi:hypothetical protein